MRDKISEALAERERLLVKLATADLTDRAELNSQLHRVVGKIERLRRFKPEQVALREGDAVRLRYYREGNWWKHKG